MFLKNTNYQVWLFYFSLDKIENFFKTIVFVLYQYSGGYMSNSVLSIIFLNTNGIFYKQYFYLSTILETTFCISKQISKINVEKNINLIRFPYSSSLKKKNPPFLDCFFT